MADRGFRIKADPTKQGWENSEFPILCETCLGDNPYVRMTKEKYGAACHVCDRPYTRFRWKAGTAGRYKVTVLCQMCAKLKNVCQCCMLDSTYGVPVGVRDAILARTAAAAGSSTALVAADLAGSGSTAASLSIGSGLAGSSVPMSEVNRTYAIMQAEKALGDAGGVVPYSGLAAIAPAAHEELMRLGRNKAHYARNLPKLCTFFARGECTRGTECPYRHEMPADPDNPLNKQNYKDRYYGSEDPVATKMLTKRDARAAEDAAAGKTGDRPPAAPFNGPSPQDDDEASTTLWIGGLDNVPGGVAVDDVRSAMVAIAMPLGLLGADAAVTGVTAGGGGAAADALLSHVHITAPKGVVGPSGRPASSCAFVEFRGHAEALACLKAIQAANGVLLRGVQLPTRWARPRAPRGSGKGGDGGGSGGSGLYGDGLDEGDLEDDTKAWGPTAAAAGAGGAGTGARPVADGAPMPPIVAAAGGGAMPMPFPFPMLPMGMGPMGMPNPMMMQMMMMQQQQAMMMQQQQAQAAAAGAAGSAAAATAPAEAGASAAAATDAAPAATTTAGEGTMAADSDAAAAPVTTGAADSASSDDAAAPAGASAEPSAADSAAAGSAATASDAAAAHGGSGSASGPAGVAAGGAGMPMPMPNPMMMMQMMMMQQQQAAMMMQMQRAAAGGGGMMPMGAPGIMMPPIVGMGAGGPQQPGRVAAGPVRGGGREAISQHRPRHGEGSYPSQHPGRMGSSGGGRGPMGPGGR